MSYSDYYHKQRPSKCRKVTFLEAFHMEEEDEFDKLACTFTDEADIQKLWNDTLVQAHWDYYRCVNGRSAAPVTSDTHRP